MKMGLKTTNPAKSRKNQEKDTMAKSLVSSWVAVLMVGVFAVAAARAQTTQAVPVPAEPRLSGQTLQGQDFDLGRLQGKVVMVLFWSTNCAVCRDKMAELRANYQGWRGKPFELVLVSTDRRVQDVHDYERILALTVPSAQQFPQLWTGHPGYVDNFGAQAMLPATYIIGKTGQVETAYLGRIPPQAWDDIAELL